MPGNSHVGHLAKLLLAIVLLRYLLGVRVLPQAIRFTPRDPLIRGERPATPGPTHSASLRVPLGLKGWALGRLRLKRLKTGLGRF